MPEDTQACPHCGSPVEPTQEYCLECGVRLHTPGLVPTLERGWRRRLRWYPGDWIWPSLVALVVAAVAGGAAIWWTRDAESAAAQTFVGDTSQLPTTPTTLPAPPTSPTVPTSTTRTTGTTGTTTERRSPKRPIEWPKGRNGWTLVVVSVPMSAGRQQALARARQALDAGLTQVGVIDSSRFSSLHPGYYVIFSGIYPSLGEAQAAASKAAAAGYGNAYARRITR